MVKYGLDYQAKIYTKAEPHTELPTSIVDWRKRAKGVLSADAWGYLEGSAGENDTMRENRQAFKKWRIRPRYLRNTETCDLSVEIFGKKFETPFILAPIGVQSILHKDGEIATANAAVNMHMPFVLSTVSSVSMEEIASNTDKGEKWFQLYPGKDMDVMKSMVLRAEQSGYTAIVVTVDTTMLGWRETDLKNAYLPFLHGEGIANYLTDPVFKSRLNNKGEESVKTAIAEFLSIYVNPAFGWDDLKEIRKWTKLPILIKGISHKEDVKTAFEIKADAVIISNHGGRQVDGAISALDALDEVTMDDDLKGTILFDSGIRHAADAVKALSLGASAVLIGRPYAYALAVGGRAGVERYLDQLRSEFDLEMALAGYTSIKELSRSNLFKSFV